MSHLYRDNSTGNISLAIDGMLRSVQNMDVLNRIFRPNSWVSLAGQRIQQGRPLCLQAKLVRDDRSGVVYFLDDLGQGLIRRHCVSPEMFEACCFDWGKIVSMTAGDFNIPEGKPLSVQAPVLAWMESEWETIKNKTFRELCLPGTHDSGTYKLNDRLAPDATGAPKSLWEYGRLDGLTGLGDYIKGMAVTQTKSFYEQLSLGIRYLDLRVCHMDNDYYTCHTLQGNPISILLADVKKFLDENKKEVVLIKVGFKELTDDQKNEAWRKMEEWVGGHFYKMDGGKNFKTLQLQEVVNSNKRALFLLNDTHIKGIYDSDNNTNSKVCELLRSRTLFPYGNWFNIASEGESISIPKDRTVRVRYGKNDKWIEKVVTGGTVTFGVAFFGEDPAPNVLKQGDLFIEYEKTTTTSEGTWFHIANESESITLPNNRTVKVRYGKDDKWFVKTVTGGVVTFGVSFFNGDPNFGIVKHGEIMIDPEYVLRLKDTQLLEAQCIRPIDDMTFVKAFVQKYGCGLLPFLPTLWSIPVVGQLLSALGATVPHIVFYLRNIDPVPTDLRETARDSRSILRNYVQWLESDASRPHPQLIICDYVEEVPLVEIAIRLSTNRSCQDLLAGIQDIPKPIFSEPLAHLGCGADVIAAALKVAGYGCNQAGQFLQDNIPGIPGEVLGGALKGAGYGLNEVGGFLKDAYNYTAEGLNIALKNIGYAAEEIGGFFRSLGGEFETFFTKTLANTAESVGDVFVDTGKRVGNAFESLFSGW